MRPTLAILALSAVSLLCACGARSQDNTKVDGKTAEQWEAEAAQDEAEANRLLGQTGTQPAPVQTAAPQTATPQAAAGGAAPIQNGTFTCISGFRTMLTLGEMTISGNSYRFHPPTGPDTTGTYSYAPGHISWSGDIGIVKNSQITESDLDQGHRSDDFWFKFNFDPSHENTVNCKL